MKSNKEKIEEILGKVRPFIQMHGGDVELVKIQDDLVLLRVQGACVGCPLAHMTYDTMIGGLIREEVPEIQKVIIEQ